MMIIGCDYHPGFQQIASVDRETGEFAARRLAHEAADAGLLSPDLAAGISRVKGVKQLGQRSGNRLSLEHFSKVSRVAMSEDGRISPAASVLGS